MANSILRFIVGFAKFLFGAIIAVLLAGAVILPFAREKMEFALANETPAIPTWQAIGMMELAILGIVVLCLLALYFFVLLSRLLETVEQRDPFVAENSERLTRMAWVAVAGNVWSVILSVYLAFVENRFEKVVEAKNIHIDVDFGGIGLVLILVLFVLASVFRKGTEMRADLEGTV